MGEQKSDKIEEPESDNNDSELYWSDTGIKTLETLEHEAISKAYVLAKGNPERACLMLGISRATLYRKLKKYKISMDESSN